MTCYKQPDYVRAVTLRRALASDPNNTVIVIKNSHKGILRYGEVLCKLIWIRLRQRPDVYLLTFRGYEILPAFNLLTWPKPVVFDEFINPLEWLNEPRPELWAPLVPKRLLRSLYRLLIRRSSYVLADTDAHASSSAHLTFGKAYPRIVAVPVSTDEEVFKPERALTKRASSTHFTVFYYGNMLPLHGIEHVFAAARELRDEPIRFEIVGGSSATAKAAEAARQEGAHLRYRPWVSYAALPREIHRADLCLGGPFGDTAQARQVITGKTYQFLAAGAAVVVGKNDASHDFADKANCLLVPLGNTYALVRAIRWAYKHPKDLAAIRKKGRQLYQQKFSNDHVAAQLSALLQTLKC